MPRDNAPSYMIDGLPTGEWSRFVSLLYGLTKREWRSRYRKSCLGMTWAIVQPVTYLFLFLWLHRCFSIPSDGMPYALFAYAALAPWTFFGNAVTRAASSIGANGSLIRKMRFPREVFPLAAIAMALVDFSISMLLLLGLIAWFHIYPSLAWLWLLPIMAVIVCFSAGVALFFTAIGTFRRDIIFGLPIMMQLWMFLSPVMYSVEQVPEKWRMLYQLNPMTPLINAFRDSLVKGIHLDLGPLGLATALSILTLLAGWATFRRLSQYFADTV